MTSLPNYKNDDRKRGIGASEIGAVLGWSPWLTPAELWAQKTGSYELIETPAMLAGRYVERAIADWYGDLTGYHLANPNKMLWHPQNPTAFATPDRLVETPWGGKGLLECKATRMAGARKWPEYGRIPKHYYAQIQWQMYCTGRDWCAFAWLYAGAEFGEMVFSRDDCFLDGLIEKAAEFWQFVESDTPPPDDWPEADPPADRDTEKPIEISGQVFMSIHGIKVMRTLIRSTQKREKELADALRELYPGDCTLAYQGLELATISGKNRQIRIR